MSVSCFHRNVVSLFHNSPLVNQRHADLGRAPRQLRASVLGTPYSVFDQCLCLVFTSMLCRCSQFPSRKSMPRRSGPISEPTPRQLRADVFGIRYDVFDQFCVLLSHQNCVWCSHFPSRNSMLGAPRAVKHPAASIPAISMHDVQALQISWIPQGLRFHEKIQVLIQPCRTLHM